MDPETVPKIRLRLSNDSSGLNASVVSPLSQTCETMASIGLKKARKLTRVHRYDELKMRQAMADMQNGMSTKGAAIKWGVPRTTLQNRKKMGFAEVRRRPGPATILTPDEENVLCEWVIELSRRAMPVRKNFLLDSIQRILKEDARPTPFVNSRPGKGWFRAFLRRHPEVAERYAEPISRGRAKLTENAVRGWFEDAEKFFEERNCRRILEDPTRQYNGDETGFQLDPRSGRVLAPRNENIYTEAGGTKEQLTALITTRGDGILMPTAVVYPYKRAVPKDIVNQIPDDF